MSSNSILQKLFLLLFLVIAAPVVAQQDSGPTSLLPDIDPQDIEIRGEFNVRFPGLSRQPILGFSPRPPVYRVDPDRMPYIESDEEVVASIPLSDLEPALKPEQHFIRFAEHQRVFARTGYGSFQSPEVSLIAELPVREDESLALDFSHHSSAGDRDYSSFRDLDGDIQWTRRTGNSRWGVGLTGTSTFNYSPQLVSDALPDGASYEAHRINHNSFGIEGRWQHLENAYRGWQAAASINRFTGEGELFTGDVAETRESRYNIQVNRFWEGPVQEQVFGLRARATGGFYDTITDTTQYWLTNTVGARYRHTFGHAHQVETWLRLFQLYDPVNEFDIYLYPDVQYTFQGSGRVSAGIRVRGFVNDPTLEKHHKNNRFALQYGQDLEHERGLHIRLHSDVRITSQITAYTGLDYWQYYNKAYFSSPQNSESAFFVQQFAEEATHLEWYHGITHYFSALRTTTNVEFGLNYSGVDEEQIPSGEIPYVPSWRGSVHMMSRPVDRLDISAWMDLMGERNTDIAGEAVDGFTQLGIRADVRIFNNFGAYIKALNILDQEYEVWQNYIERPFQLYGGLTLHW